MRLANHRLTSVSNVNGITAEKTSWPLTRNEGIVAMIASKSNASE